MAITIQIPLLNGDGSKVAITLQLPQPSVSTSTVAWTSGTPATGTVTPSQDKQSALFTTVAAGTTLITAVLKPTAGTWTPRKLYRLGEQIIDINNHIQEVTGSTRRIPSVYTPDPFIPQGGDVTQANMQYGGPLVDGDKQFGTVLNQDPGAINGDWPAGGLNAGGAGKIPTTAAPVTFVVGGFSGRGANGASTPISYTNDTRQQIAGYSEIGPGGLRTYIDAAGNSHTGWVLATGSQVAQLPAGQPPVFNTSGSTTLDGDLTWTDRGLAGAGGAAGATTTYNQLTVQVITGASLPFGNFLIVS